MASSDFFLYLFSFLAFLFSIFVITTKNPLYSIIFLILVFINSACLLIYEGAEFLAFVILIVYVGAIAVLFLFVIYMLNIKLIEMNEENWTHFFSILFSLLPIILIIYYNVTKSFNIFVITENFNFFCSSYEFISNKESFTSLKILSRFIYIEYYIIFIMISCVLLVAMVGSIVLTSRRSISTKEQDIYEQTKRYNS